MNYLNCPAARWTALLGLAVQLKTITSKRRLRLCISIANQKNYTRTMMLDRLQMSFKKVTLSRKKRKW